MGKKIKKLFSYMGRRGGRSCVLRSFLLEAVGEFSRKGKKYVSTLKEHHQRMLMLLLQPDFEEGKEKETFKV